VFSVWLCENIRRVFLLTMILAPADLVSALCITATIIHDAVSSVQRELPKYPQAIWNSLRSPFQNFLTLEDLEDAVGPVAGRPRLKTSSLVALGLLQCAGWLACFVYALVGDPEQAAAAPLLISLAWVCLCFFCVLPGASLHFRQGYTSLRLVLHPPITPPFLSIIFASIQFVVPLLRLTLDVVHTGGSWSTVLPLDFACITAAVLFVWIAGTLPLQTIAPAENVAGPKDVGTLFLWASLVK
jgi:hypothetical protein